MKDICFLLWIFLSSCLIGCTCSFPMYTDDASPDENINRELYLIKILQNLREKDTNENDISDINSSFTNSLQKGKYITDETMDAVLVPSKRDMGVLPPWNEFCRMMRITHCFHSRQS